MAGRGERFSKAGYTTPKPLIPIHGIPMIAYVLSNLRPHQEHRWILLCQSQHIENFDLVNILHKHCDNATIVHVNTTTAGAACTVLLAKEQINNDEPLMIANCDQYIDIDINSYLQAFDNSSLDGMIMTMTASDPKWSYVRTDNSGIACEVAEKTVISPEASVGIYNFRTGKQFVDAAEDMINKQLRVNNEYYVAPVYNEIIAEGGRVGIFNIGNNGCAMHGLGIPDDLESFITHPASLRAATNIKS